MNFLSRLTRGSKIEERKSKYRPEHNWEIVRKLKNPICGDHFLVQNTKTGEIVMKKIIGTENDESAERMNKNLSMQVSLELENVLRLLDFDLEIRSDLCSKLFYFSLYYDYPEKNLGDILIEARDEPEDLSHEMLLQVFYDTAGGLTTLGRKSAKRELGRLQLNRVYKDGERFKVIENMMNHKVSDLYMNLVLSRDKMAIMAPEIVTEKRPPFDQLNLAKLDTFNLGLVILSLGNKLRPNVFYTYSFSEFKKDELETQKKLFKEKYRANPLLCKIMEDLLVNEVAERLELKEILKKYPSAGQVSAFIKSFHIGSSQRRASGVRVEHPNLQQNAKNMINRKSEVTDNSNNKKRFKDNLKDLSGLKIHQRSENTKVRSTPQKVYRSYNQNNGEVKSTLPLKSPAKAKRYNATNRRKSGHTRVKSQVVGYTQNGVSNSNLSGNGLGENSQLINSRMGHKSYSEAQNSWLSGNMQGAITKPGAGQLGSYTSPYKHQVARSGGGQKFFNSPGNSRGLSSYHVIQNGNSERRGPAYSSGKVILRSRSYNEKGYQRTGQVRYREVTSKGQVLGQYGPSKPVNNKRFQGKVEKPVIVADDDFFG